MKSAIQYFFFLLVGLLLGLTSLHALNPLVPGSKIMQGQALQVHASHHFFDQPPANDNDNDSVISEEDDEEDYCFKRQAAFFKSFLALTQYFQAGKDQDQATGCLPFDEHFFLGSPRYILQRVIRI